MRLQVAAPARLLGPLGSTGRFGTTVARKLVNRLFRDHPTKRFAVRLWDGTEIAWRPERDFTLVVHDAATFGSLVLSHAPAAFAEAYVDGRLGIEGDVDAAVELAWYLRSAPGPAAHGGLEQAAASLRRTRADDARHVRAHYDLPEDFFRLFLDQKMVYSCAYFSRADEPLEAAQERKLDLICRKLCLRPGESFLDVGCGWGALVIWAAQRYGVRAHGITLSRSQAEAARANVARMGLADRVTIEECHYDDLSLAVDKIASVGMIEHVGIGNYGTYFERLYGALRPGGLLLNHGITQPPNAPDTGGAFVLKHVFPGAELDELAHTLAVMQDRGFEILDVQSLRPHYALTLRAWDQRYAAQRAEASRVVSKRTLRIWDLYLPGCRRGFEEGLISVHQCLAAKPDACGGSAAPLTREETLLFHGVSHA
jgi:cyclopropane-fatty-acyl-phospholipid synthase